MTLYSTMIFTIYAHAVKLVLALLKSLPDTSNEPEISVYGLCMVCNFKIWPELGTLVVDNLNPDPLISISNVGTFNLRINA